MARDYVIDGKQILGTVLVNHLTGETYTASGGSGGDASAANQTAVQATAGNDASKAVAVQGITGGKAVAISAASLPLPTGAATAAKQPALGTAGTASSDVITIQGIASMTPIAVRQELFSATTTFTRPADTTAYASGDALSNSTSAGTQLTLTVGSANQPILIQKVALVTNSTTALSVEAWVAGATLSAATANDNAALNIDLNSMTKDVNSISLSETSSVSANSRMAASNLVIPVTCDASGNIYILLKLLGAYTPTSGQSFRILVLGIKL